MWNVAARARRIKVQNKNHIVFGNGATTTSCNPFTEKDGLCAPLLTCFTSRDVPNSIL